MPNEDYKESIKGAWLNVLKPIGVKPGFETWIKSTSPYSFIKGTGADGKPSGLRVQYNAVASQFGKYASSTDDQFHSLEPQLMSRSLKMAYSPVEDGFEVLRGDDTEEIESTIEQTPQMMSARAEGPQGGEGPGKPSSSIPG